MISLPATRTATTPQRSSDPAFKLAQNTLPSGPNLASQPTLSRLEN